MMTATVQQRLAAALAALGMTLLMLSGISAIANDFVVTAQARGLAMSEGHGAAPADANPRTLRERAAAQCRVAAG